MIESVSISAEDGLGAPRVEAVVVQPFKKVKGTSSTLGRCWLHGAQYEVVRHNNYGNWLIVGRTSATDAGQVKV